MKRLLSVGALLLFIFLAACRKEAGVNAGSGSVADFQPTGAGSQWNYSSTSTGNFTIKSVGSDSLINGIKYYKFDRIGGGMTTRFYESKTNGVYHQYAYFPQAAQTIDLIILKDSAVGTTWTNALSVQGISNFHKYTVSQRGIQRVVNGTTYNNVIELNYELSISNPLGFGPPISAGGGKNYYAKGVGAIESFYNLGAFGFTVTDTTKLLNYTK